MKTFSCLIVAVAFVACGSDGGPGDESAPISEGAAGSSGSLGQGASGQAASGGGVGDAGGHFTTGGAGGNNVQPMGGSGGVSATGGSGGGTSMVVAACPPDSTTCPTMGGFAPACGAGHCADASGKAIVQTTTYDTCHPDRLPTMGVGHPVNTLKGKFLPTLHGTEGDDDQCKYHVKIAVDAVAKNQDVTFTLNATNLGDGSVVKDNSPEPAVDVFLSASHMVSTTAVKSTMTSPGTFKVGPVRFDQCGEWTVRFHFFNHCGNDFLDSPYASIAFYVNVP